jgi:predicted dienelactone hydrolase
MLKSQSFARSSGALWMLAGALVVCTAAACSDDSTESGADASADATPDTDVQGGTDADGSGGTDDGSSSGEPDADTGVEQDGEQEADTDGSGEALPDWSSLELDAAGPYRVGHRIIEHTYTSPASGLERTINVHIWYPTEATEGEPAQYLGAIFSDLDAFEDVVPSPPIHGERYPLMAYSHGDQGFAGTSSFLMRHFASHGWVAVGPDHTGNLLGSTIEPRPTALYLDRATDMSQSLDVLEGLVAPDPLAGLVDTERVVISGHSFGVHSVWTSLGADFAPDKVDNYCVDAGDCTDDMVAAFLAWPGDDRFVAGIALAGSLRRSWFGDTGHEAVSERVLSMSGSDDLVGADTQFAETVGVELAWVEIEGACHQGFALGGCSFISDEASFRLVNTWSLAFARYEVLEDRGEAVLSVLRGEDQEGLSNFETRLTVE